MTIYLDHAATSWPKAPSAIDAMAAFLNNDAANPGRSGHAMAQRAADAVWQCRLALSRYLEAKPERVIFTGGATDSLNMAIHGFLELGDRVLMTPMEHNSVIRPLYHCRDHLGVNVDVMAVDSQGSVDLLALEQSLAKSPVKLICVNHASNVNGVIQALEEIKALAHKHGAKVLADCAQSAGTIPVHRGLADMLAIPGHKGLMGPTGIGVLYVDEDVRLQSLRQGGTGAFSELETMPEEMPEALEAGTLNAIGIVGLHRGLQWIQRPENQSAIQKKTETLRNTFLALEKLDRIRIYGLPLLSKDSVAVACFNIEGYEAQDLAAILDSSFDIAVRAGLHCAPMAHKVLKTGHHGAVRVSLGMTNTKEDLEKFVEAIEAIHG
jgi:cysteine desulfurase / selenocysteine lyase